MLIIKFEVSYKGNQLIMHKIQDIKKARFKTVPFFYVPVISDSAYNVKVYVYFRSNDLLLNNGNLGFSISRYVLRPSLKTI
jgi:hypothetical protein